MSDPKWTAETEELVARAWLASVKPADERLTWDAIRPASREAYLEIARTALTALADAGLLLAPGGETREEFRVVYDNRYGQPVIWSGGPWLGRENAEASRQKAIDFGYVDAAIQKRTTGPWLPVSDGGGA